MKNQTRARLIASLALAAIFAILALPSDDPAFKPTEIKPAPAPIGAVETQLVEAEPAEIVCTFRCGVCQRAPTLTYYEGDSLPVIATCKQCGRKMWRTDPPLTNDERARLPSPPAAQQGRRMFRAACST